jgi:GT2 family glycosyltransferase
LSVRHTVCLVTYERHDFLERCLTALHAHTSADTQIVIVDASEGDDSAAVAAIRPSAHYVHAPQLAGWMTRSRNEGLRSVRGEVVSFLDDDVVVSEGWQSALLDAFADPSVDAVAGRTRNLQPGEDVYDLPIGRLQPDGWLTEGFASLPGGIVDVDHGIGANMSFRRDLLARLGGFRDDYPGTAMREDTDIFLRIRRLGGRTVFAPAAVVDHLPAPHAKGQRFDTRYKLYARRNHLVLLARDDGIRSLVLRKWLGREFAQVTSARGVRAKARRLGITIAGVGWGALAMARQARWRPSAPVRDDALGREIRDALGSPRHEPA